jgi:hypothetical protein
VLGSFYVSSFCGIKRVFLCILSVYLEVHCAQFFFFFFNILKKKKLWSSNLMQWKKGLRSVLLQTPKENERGKEWP